MPRTTRPVQHQSGPIGRAALAVAGVLLGVVGLLVVAAPSAIAAPVPAAARAAAPTEGSCGFATSGTYGPAICWLDLAGYDPALAGSAAGQDLEFAIGEYQVTMNLLERGVPGYNRRVMQAVTSPINAGAFGGGGYYDSIPGSPFLYTNASPRNAGNEVIMRNVEVTLDGTPVDGYALVSVDPETTDDYAGIFGETIVWNSDVPVSMLDHNTTRTDGGGCTIPPFGNGTTQATCYSFPGGGDRAHGLIVSAPNATYLSGQVYETTAGERQAIGFGIMVSRLTLDKEVDGRINPEDSFDLSVTAPEDIVIGEAGTGTADSASTGQQMVIPSGEFTLAETATAGTPTLLSNYTQAWSCINSVTSTTVLPTGDGLEASVDLQPGDDVTCTLTNTAKAVGLTLDKTADRTDLVVGQQVTYSFGVTNTGDLPLTDLDIDETAFSGSPAISVVDCPQDTLAIGETVTCTATYQVSQADLDAGTLSNTAVATALPPGASAPIASEPDRVDIDGAQAPQIALTKTADRTQAAPGDTVTYTLTATNQGNVTLTDVVIAEDTFSGAGTPGALSCTGPQPATLAPVESVSCTVTYQVVSADEVAGSVDNAASVSGTAPDQTVVTDDATAAIVVSAPVTTEPTTTEPTTTEPTTTEPTTTEPSTSQPTTTEPSDSEPTSSVPTSAEVSNSGQTTGESTVVVTTSTGTDPGLANTGVPTVELITFGAGLTLAGLGLLTVRRRTGRHA